MMLVVSIVAWLALLLAEAGQFRLAPILLIVGGIGLSLLVYAVRMDPAVPTNGRPTSALAATTGILLCAALFLPPYETAVAGGDATVYLNFGRQIGQPRRARVRGRPAPPALAHRPRGAVPESGALGHDGPVCTIPWWFPASPTSPPRRSPPAFLRRAVSLDRDPQIHLGRAAHIAAETKQPTELTTNAHAIEDGNLERERERTALYDELRAIEQQIAQLVDHIRRAAGKVVEKVKELVRGPQPRRPSRRRPSGRSAAGRRSRR